MQEKESFFEFEWDKANLSKSYFEHGVLPKETEEFFLDNESIVLSGIEHSKKEERFIIFGKTVHKHNLFVVFTFRQDRIRVISARKMHKKEVLKYEKIKEDTKV